MSPLHTGKRVHMSLLANPSHLEAVDPIVLGKVRAKQHFSRDTDRAKNLGILLHGDGAFAGQVQLDLKFPPSCATTPVLRRCLLASHALFPSVMRAIGREVLPTMPLKCTLPRLWSRDAC